MPNNDRAQRRLNAKRAAKQNRHQLEALRREQAKRESRRFLLVTGVVVLVGLILIAAVTVPSYLRTRNSPSHKSVASFGTAAAAATCDPDTKLAAEAGPPEAKTPEEADRFHLSSTPPVWTTYKDNPPASGPHNPQPLPTGPHFYAPTAQSEPSFVEQLVHNLEHGFVVVWYDDTIAQDKSQLKTLEDVGTAAQARGNQLIIVAPWPKTRPAMDSGKHIAITSWRQRQLCNGFSGAVLESFMNVHTPLCAPEPETRLGTQPAEADIKAACGALPTPLPSSTPSASISGSPSPTTSGTSTPSTSPSPTTSSTAPSSTPTTSPAPSPSGTKSTKGTSASPSPSAT